MWRIAAMSDEIVNPQLKWLAKCGDHACLNLLVSFLAPFAIGADNGRFVHFVDSHNHFGDAQRLCQLCMLSCLPTPLETCLKLRLRTSRTMLKNNNRPASMGTQNRLKGLSHAAQM